MDPFPPHKLGHHLWMFPLVKTTLEGNRGVHFRIRQYRINKKGHFPCNLHFWIVFIALAIKMLKENSLTNFYIKFETF